MGGIASKTTLGGFAGMAIVAFLGYCIYFDNKRRRHPDFKRKLHERRHRNEKDQEWDRTQLPRTQRDGEDYFLEQIQKSEKNIVEGNEEGAAENLLHAVLMCGQPEKLIAILQESVPVEVFALLIAKVIHHNSRIQLAGNESFVANELVSDHASFFEQPLYQ